MYADDTMLFCRANLEAVTTLFECIHTYDEWSGQKISPDKSGLIVSPDVRIFYMD